MRLMATGGHIASSAQMNALRCKLEGSIID